MKKLEWILRLLLVPFWELRYRLIRVLRFYVGVQNYKQYESYRKYPDYLKFGGAVNYIIDIAKPMLKGKGLDIGCSKWPIDGARPIDYTEEEHAAKINEKSASIDFIFASHLIEHLDNVSVVLKEWNRVLRIKGTLFLYVPHPSCEMWNVNNNPYHVWNPSFHDLKKYLENEGFQIINYSDRADAYLSYFIHAEKIS